LRKKGLTIAKGTGLATGGGVVGFVFGKLSSTDLRAIIEKLIDLFKQQGPYAFYALLMTVVFSVLIIWLVKTLLSGKDTEITRISGQRDKFEQLFIDDWKTTRKELVAHGKTKKG
jgi:hypothetical protein